MPMPLIIAASWYFTRYLQPRHQHYWEAVGRQASALMGMLSGIRVVKAFVQEGREIERFRGRAAGCGIRGWRSTFPPPRFRRSWGSCSPWAVWPCGTSAAGMCCSGT